MTMVKRILVLVVLLVAGALGVAAQEGAAATVMFGGNADLGAFLVDASGMTLYIFAMDSPGVTNCYGDCAVNWPPLLVGEDETPTLAAGIPGRLGVVTRTDGARQVAYNGMPLYYWIRDRVPGDATGHLVGDVWFVAAPPTIALGGNAELGTFLVGETGRTLYLFTRDEPGVSNCYDQCAANWPPLVVGEDEEPTILPGLGGTLGVIERTDGLRQVTYNDMPLYYWVNDKAAGDATGQNVNGVWFVIKPPTVSVRSSAELGDFLVGPDGMTLYTFANDQPGVSSCVDRCAVNWPPLLVAAGEQPTASAELPGTLGVIERADGTFQVTYNDMPLYTWIRDVIPGDTTGHLVGDVWFVASVGGETSAMSDVDDLYSGM